MPIVDANAVAATHVPPPFERELKLVMSPETSPDVTDFTLIFSTLAPRGGCTDFHAHQESGELMVFVSGTGRAWLGSEEYELKPGMVMYAPAGVEHKTENTGDEPLFIICVFIPPAPPDYLSASLRAVE